MGFVPLQLLLPSRFAEFGNGLGFAGCLGLVDWYLGVDFLDHATAVEGDKAGGGCLGQFGQICRRCFCAALVDHVVSEALGLGRWVQGPCRAHSDCGQAHGGPKPFGATTELELQACWKLDGHGVLGRRFRVLVAQWSSTCSVVISTSKTSHTFIRPRGDHHIRLSRQGGC
jgi:hypothetical protein